MFLTEYYYMNCTFVVPAAAGKGRIDFLIEISCHSGMAKLDIELFALLKDLL